jgi:hypothetical protein
MLDAGRSGGGGRSGNFNDGGAAREKVLRGVGHVDG